MSVSKLVQHLTLLNEQYRSGNPTVSDQEYDLLIQELKSLDPSHPYLKTVEPEVITGEKFKHPDPMLSTAKAYEAVEIEKWVQRIVNAAKEVGIINPTIRCTTKLDGVACRYLTAPLLATRGDGETGRVITTLLDNGLVIKGDASIGGVGEIVMPQSYFDKNLSHMTHPRSVVAGIVNSDKLSDESKQIMADGAVQLVLYKDMPHVELPVEDFLLQHGDIEQKLRLETDYPFDGVVYEVVEQEVKDLLGSNSHHNVWQIAKKQRAEGVESTVTAITYPIGRTSVLTPLIHIEPVTIDGSVVSKMTGHYVGKLIEKQIGIGAKVKVIKAGEIIPAVESVLVASDDMNLPTCCPHCSSEIEKRDVAVTETINGKTKQVTKKNANWFCTNHECVGKAKSSIIYHFELVKAQLFGKATVAKLIAGGFNSIQSIYSMTKADFVQCGLGEGQADNLLDELNRVRAEPISDYQLIASLGISNLGRGTGKKLFAKHKITEITDVTAEQLESIEGFGEITSVSITEALRNSQLLPFLLDQYAHVLVHTKDEIAAQEAKASSSPLGGKKVVFTGTCSMPRTQMANMAKELGCEVQKSVVKGTDYLVCGLNVGAKKIEAAKNKGATILNEAEFLKLSQQTATVETELTVIKPTYKSPDKEPSLPKIEDVPTNNDGQMALF